MKLAMFAFLALAPLARAGSYSTPQMSFPAQGFESLPFGYLYPPTFDRSLGTLDSVQLVIDRFGGLMDLAIYNPNPWPGSVLFSDPAGYRAQLWLQFPHITSRWLKCTVPPKRVFVPPTTGPLHIIQTATCYGLELTPSSDPALLERATSMPVNWALRFRIYASAFPPTVTSGGPFNDDFQHDPPYLATIGATVHVVYYYH